MTDVDTQETRPRGDVGRVMLALWAQKESHRVAGELRSAGIPVLLLKGPDLQQRLYGTPAAYASSDVDLLIPRARATVARRVLESVGWRFAPENGTLWRVSRAASFDREGFTVDLHWGLHAAHLPAWSLEPLGRRLWRGARYGASGMLEPDAESLLVFLAVHAVGHRFERPEWGENVHRAAALVQDWDEVWRIARAARVTNAVRASLADGGKPSADVLDGSWGTLVSGTTWVTRGHFLPLSFREQVRGAVALGREGLGYVTRGRRVRIGDVDLEVPIGVFRPWKLTEELVAVALDAIEHVAAPLVFDVGTGSGAAAVLIARARPDARVYGTDVSARAIGAASRNVERLKLSNVTLERGDLLGALPSRLHGRVDAVVTNLPADPPAAARLGSEREPRSAVVGLDADGLGLLRELANRSRPFLRPGGKLIVMLLDWQWELLSADLASAGYRPAGDRPSDTTAYRFGIAERS
jgi:methylase of polypeptide subunit release factors